MAKVTHSNRAIKNLLFLLSDFVFSLSEFNNGFDLLSLSLSLCFVSKQKKKSNNENKGDGGGDKKTASITVVLKVDMHCDGCASKIVKCARAFKGLFFPL